jgi:hypothetical protein
VKPGTVAELGDDLRLDICVTACVLTGDLLDKERQRGDADTLALLIEARFESQLRSCDHRFPFCLRPLDHDDLMVDRSGWAVATSACDWRRASPSAIDRSRACVDASDRQPVTRDRSQRRRPSAERVAEQVAGADAARIVRLAEARSRPPSSFDSPNRSAYVGTSGTSAVHTTSPKKIAS